MNANTSRKVLRNPRRSFTLLACSSASSLPVSTSYFWPSGVAATTVRTLAASVCCETPGFAATKMESHSPSWPTTRSAVRGVNATRVAPAVLSLSPKRKTPTNWNVSGVPVRKMIGTSSPIR